ncbi:hypothetical protein [Ohtaekwangia koreensis]|uniref:hypothetical protein n=1 Tax=Ohtaekwangia koreensis TaxID=688867 RepID=UPI00117D52A2|nr:hypothetical protein [Ohtaekwangia koreensis]
MNKQSLYNTIYRNKNQLSAVWQCLRSFYIKSCLPSLLFTRTDHRPVVVPCVFSTLAFIGIDFYYALSDTISDIYMADGIFTNLLLIGWIYVVLANSNELKLPAEHVYK